MPLAPPPSAPTLRRASQILDTADRWMEQHKIWIQVMFSAVFLTACWFISQTKIMWFDELATYYPARFGSVHELLRFFGEGLDVHTPTAALIMRASISLLGDNPIGIRAPFILGFLLLSLSLFGLAAHHLRASYAAAAMVFPAITSSAYYATEARPYPIVMGLAGLSLLSWRWAAGGIRRKWALLLLFASLSLALALHYYAILLWAPIGLAELVRWRERGKPDWAVFLLLAAALFPLALFFPAMQKAGAAYKSGFWSTPNLGQIEMTYRGMLTLALAPMLAVLLIWATLKRFLGASLADAREGATLSIPTAERVAIGTLALLPAIGVPLSFLTGVYVDRYTLPSIAGLSLFFVLVAAARSRNDRLLGLSMAGFLMFWFCFKSLTLVRKQFGETGGYPYRTAMPFASRSWMDRIARSGLPVAVSPTVFFFQFFHYAPPEVRGRLHYLVSRQYAKQFDGIDTGDTSLIRYTQMIPLPTVNYDDFTATEKHFLLIAETTNPTWVVEKLLAGGASLQLLNRQGTFFLFDVTL